MIDFKNAFIRMTKTRKEDATDVIPLLVKGEDILSVYKTVRDHIVFTNKRIVVVNVQGLTGKKKDFTSLPYSKIQVYSVETAGLLDADCELDLWFSGLGHVKFEFSGHSDIVEISRLISDSIL